MHVTAHGSSKGFTLVELMVGMTVGLFVILAMSAVYINSVRGSSDATNANRLNQDLRAVMDIMVADIRRAGYWGTATTGGSNPFTRRTSLETDIYISGNCILYAYDATYLGGVAGTPDMGVDFFGFRLDTANEVLQMASDSTYGNTAVGCDTVRWDRLTDPAAVRITALTFDTVGSQCIAFDQTHFNPTTLVTPTIPGSSTYGAWWPVTAGTTPACASAPPGGVTVPATADARVEIRQINITLTGVSARDATLQRTLTESVVVRNNRVVGS